MAQSCNQIVTYNYVTFFNPITLLTGRMNSTTTILFTGTNIIDADILIDKANIKMGDDAVIEVTNGNQLTIKQGIDMRDINFSKDVPGTNIIRNNRIFYTIPHSQIITTTPHFGIRLTKCRNIKILSNEMERNLSFGNYSTDAPYISGVSLNQAIGCPIANNSMYGIPTGIKIEAANPGTKLQCNYMEDSYNGVHFGTSVAATLSDQGTVISPTSNAGWDNYWNYPSSITNKRVTGNVNPFKWYYRNSSGLNNIYYPENNCGVNMTIFAGANGQTPCPVTNAAQSIVREEELGKIVRDSLTYSDHTTENKWYHNQYAFISFKYDTALLTVGNSDDSLYQAWYNHYAASNIALFSAVYDSIAAGNNSSAASINASITPGNTIETNLQLYYGVYFNCYNNHWVYTAEDSATLIYLACQDEFEGGEAVTSAKLILDWATDSVCEEPDERFANHESEQNEIYIFPNPASDFIYINSNFADAKDILNFTLYDLEGRKLINSIVRAKENIDVRFLKAGVYTCRINANGITTTNKLIIIK